MAYKFPFEALLKQRKREEELAKKDYVAAQSEADEALGNIKFMYSEQDRIRGEIAKKQLDGRGNVEEMRQGEDFIQGLTIKIERRRYEARELLEVAEQKHQILLEKSIEFKTIEKLKEKKTATHKETLKKKETKILEDMITMKFKRSGI